MQGTVLDAGNVVVTAFLVTLPMRYQPVAERTLGQNSMYLDQYAKSVPLKSLKRGKSE